MFGRKPVVILAALAALIQAVLIFTSGNPDVALPDLDWLYPVLTVLAGLFGEAKVVPVESAAEVAGLTPEELKTKAAAAAVARLAGKEPPSGVRLL